MGIEGIYDVLWKNGPGLVRGGLRDYDG